MILRLTLHDPNQPVDPDDLALDADMIYAVLTDKSKTTGEPVCVIHTRTGMYFTVKDPNRDVQERWMRASGSMEESI